MLYVAMQQAEEATYHICNTLEVDSSRPPVKPVADAYFYNYQSRRKLKGSTFSVLISQRGG